MKKFSFLALAAVGLMMSACSSEETVSDLNQGTLDGKGKGYLNVSVNLPTEPNVSTRGWSEAEQLNDGIEAEYAVDNVLLAVFAGTDEATATLQQVVVKNTNWNNYADTPNQVTKTSDNIVFQLNEGISGKMYVLAMLNYTDVVTPDAAAGTLTAGSKSVTKLSDLQTALSTTTDATTKFRNTNGHFFMTNAVLSDLESGNSGLNTAGHAKVLAPVVKVYESETEAAAADAIPSAEIFVERGLAKVTVTAAASIAVDGAVKDAEGAAVTAALDGWVLDNTNLSSYVVRNTFTDNQWGLFSKLASTAANNDRFRFVGVNPVNKVQTNPTAGGPAAPQSTNGSSLFYRSYWAFDPNYNGDAAAGSFYEPKVKTFPADATAPQYCFENTFDVAGQKYKNTTRVVVGVKLNGGNDFYTINGDHKVLYKEADIQAAAASALILNSDFSTWFSTNYSGKTLTGSNVTVNWKKDKAGLVKVASFKINIDAVEKTMDDATIIAAINTALGTINKYKGGISYYAIRIKHFGDDLTPWGSNGEKESTIADIYPASSSNGTQDELYLGRYGVLRNNWYLISLSSIKKIGHPIVPWLTDEGKPDPEDPKNPDPDPEDPDHPDDSLDDTYLAAKINILSWAKRPQGVVLK